MTSPAFCFPQAAHTICFPQLTDFDREDGSIGTLIRGVPYDLKITGSNCRIGHWKPVRPLIIYPSGCGHSPNPTYTDISCTELSFFLMEF